MTETTAHTPGPWSTSDDVAGHEGEIVIFSRSRRYDDISQLDVIDSKAIGAIWPSYPATEKYIPASKISPIEQKANARLIAASPDLLRALKSVVSAWTGPQTDAVWLALAAIDKAEPWAERSR